MALTFLFRSQLRLQFAQRDSCFSGLAVYYSLAFPIKTQLEDRRYPGRADLNTYMIKFSA